MGREQPAFYREAFRHNALYEECIHIIRNHFSEVNEKQVGGLGVMPCVLRKHSRESLVSHKNHTAVVLLPHF